MLCSLNQSDHSLHCVDVVFDVVLVLFQHSLQVGEYVNKGHLWFAMCAANSDGNGWIAALDGLRWF